MAHIPGFYLENFRVFEKPQTFRFSPINILTGTNNSGKSSLIKAMLLLKDNFNESTFPSRLYFDGANHRLASYSLVANKKTKPYLSFGIPISWGFPLLEKKNIQEDWHVVLKFSKTQINTDNIILDTFSIIEKKSKKLLFEMSYNHSDVSNYYHIYRDFNAVKFNFCLPLMLEINKRFSLALSDSLRSGFVVNDYLIDYYNPQKKEFFMNHKKLEGGNLKGFGKGNVFFKSTTLNTENKRLFKYVKKNGTNEFTDEENRQIQKIEYQALNDLANGNFGFNDNRDFVESLSKYLDSIGFFYFSNGVDQNNYRPNQTENFIIKNPDNSISLFEYLFYRVIYILNSEHPNASFDLDYGLYNQEAYFDRKQTILSEELKNLELFINEFISYFGKLFHRFLSNTNHISSVRVSQSRIFEVSRNKSDLMTNILASISELGLMEDDIEYFFLKHWITQLEIADSFSIDYIEGVNARILLHRGKRTINIVDHGFGSSQILSVLLQIAIQAKKNCNDNGLYQYSKSTIIIEEPEANLHPKLQSRLAELFIDAARKFNIQFIIETHSEYLIRKLQYLTSSKNHDYNISPEDTSIFYFTDPKVLKKGEKQIRRIKIREDGILDGNFGTGFFDEASNLIKDIFQVSGAN